MERDPYAEMFRYRWGQVVRWAALPGMAWRIVWRPLDRGPGQTPWPLLWNIAWSPSGRTWHQAGVRCTGPTRRIWRHGRSELAEEPIEAGGPSGAGRRETVEHDLTFGRPDTRWQTLTGGEG